MSVKYKIIITKNRQQFRFLKSYTIKENATNYFKKIIKENQKVKFEIQYVRYKPCKFHIELLSPKKFSDVIEWEKDNLGRNVPVPDRKGLYIWRLKEWKEPEEFGIYGLPGRYDYDFVCDMIRKTKETIGLFTIQNKLIFDINGKPLIAILKNTADAKRLYRVIVDDNMKNVLPFGVMSKKNRRNFYQVAKNLNIPLQLLYTKSTRW